MTSRATHVEFASPSADQHYRFLTSLIFGGTDTPTAQDITWRAYLDLSRTVHGIGRADPDGALRNAAHSQVEALLLALFADGPREISDYDAWHRTSCFGLSSLFSGRGYPAFTIGQSQKWINMGVKYGLTLAAIGGLPIEDSARLRSVAHAPLDSFFLDALPAEKTVEAPPKPTTSWSRIRDYDEYFAMQRWLRRSFAAPPLDVEFHVWLRATRDRRSTPMTA